MQSRTTAQTGKDTRLAPREELWWGLVIVFALVLLVTVVGRLILAAMVYWVYGSAGYGSGIRVHFVGKTPWFSNGERVPDLIALGSSLGGFVFSVLVAYLLANAVRRSYERLFSKRESSGA
jgi:hypothetical protein